LANKSLYYVAGGVLWLANIPLLYLYMEIFKNHIIIGN